MTKSLSFIERTLAIGWQRVEDTCSNDAHSLGLFRIIWGIYILLFFAPYSAFVSQVPQSFYNPPVISLAFLFHGFPPYWLMLAGDSVRIWLAGRVSWRVWLLVAAGFHFMNILLLNISLHIQVLAYLPFVALVRCFGRPSTGGSAQLQSLGGGFHLSLPRSY
jgi:hypothetical protein